MFLKKERRAPRWLLYVCTVALGIVFSFMLLYISWHDAIHKKEQEFRLQSISLQDAVFAGVRTADNLVNSISAFIAADPALFGGREFSIISDMVLNQYSHLEGAIFAILKPVETAGASGDDIAEGNQEEIAGLAPGNAGFHLIYQKFRGENLFLEGENMLENEMYRNVITTMLSSTSVAATVTSSAETENKHYWMFKALKIPTAGGPPGGGDVFGLFAILVNPVKLFDSSPVFPHASVTMFNDSSGMDGRRLLHEFGGGGGNNASWMVGEIKDEGIQLFPTYSIHLLVNRGIHWHEINKDLIYISLLIGLGITLLMLALVRAKELQARDLKEQNRIIEKKVEEQTKELALARDRALEASRVKSDFLASMSHEIRTPLNAIIGVSELLTETKLTHEQQKYTDIFKKAVNSLLSLVSDILDFSKIEADQLTLEEINFDLGDIIEEAVEIYTLKAADKDIELICQIDPELNTLRKGDPPHLKQIILNLISNALKFTGQGEIVVSVSAEQDSDSLVRVTVRDTGIGIPADKLETIFTSFTQVDSSTTRKYGGTGLGLTICRSLVEMMHGEIWVESVAGEGSSFIFTVPLPLAGDEQVKNEETITLTGKRILLIYDNETNKRNISAYLTHQGALVEGLGSSHDLRDRLTDSMGDYDVILLSCRLHVGNGVELLESINSTELYNKTIMMLYATELNEHRDTLDNLGMATYLVKPIRRRTLDEQIKAVIQGGRETAKTTSAKADGAEVKPLKILLVEDNPDNRLLIKAYLKKLPYELVEAENGELGVEKFQEQVYDLVLMDMQMPVMDGHTATKIIRKWEQEQGAAPTPVIALTAHAYKEEVDKCIEAGCNIYLSKPVKKSTLIETIQASAS